MGAPNPSGEGAPGGGRGKSAKGVNSVRKTPKVRHIHPKRCAKSKNPVSFSVSRFFGECFALSVFFHTFPYFPCFPLPAPGAGGDQGAQVVEHPHLPALLLPATVLSTSVGQHQQYLFPGMVLTQARTLVPASGELCSQMGATAFENRPRPIQRTTGIRSLDGGPGAKPGRGNDF